MTNIHWFSVRPQIHERRLILDCPVLTDVHKLLPDIISKLSILAASAWVVHSILVPRHAM